MNIKFTPIAWEQFNDLINIDKKQIKKINSILKSLSRGEQIAKLENLKYEFNGYQSCRIDDQNRLIFKKINDDIEIISVKGHYNDK